MAKKRLIVTPSRCIGCRSCELACSFVHAKSLNQPALPRVRTFSFTEEHHLVVLCLQCEEAACMTVCPTGALSRNKATGAVEVDHEKCIRCLACTLACPFGNIYVDPQVDEIVKCDVCKGKPACVLFCPTKTLEYAEEPSKDVVKKTQQTIRPTITRTLVMEKISKNDFARW
jgi:carbon-monoxide dehydrogenase iron sulfur subunit